MMNAHNAALADNLLRLVKERHSTMHHHDGWKTDHDGWKNEYQPTQYRLLLQTSLVVPPLCCGVAFVIFCSTGCR
jgi:hypothetical protein